MKSLISLTLTCLIYIPSFAVTVLDSNYVSESYFSYSNTLLGNPARPRYMVADEADNLYITHQNHIIEITTNKMMNTRAIPVQNLHGIALSNGGVYGNYLYVASHDSNKVIKVNQNNVPYAFSTINNPILADFDTNDNYKGKLFIGTRFAKIYAVNPTGTYHLFTSFSSCHLTDIAFDTTGKYGGLMYVNTWSSSHEHENEGIFTVTPSGDIQQFTSKYSSKYMEFDTTNGQLFDGELYVGGAHKIWKITPDGQAELFIESSDFIWNFAFSNDAMYIVKYNESDGDPTVYIDKVTLIPEPATVLLFSVAGLISLTRKNKNSH